MKNRCINKNLDMQIEVTIYIYIYNLFDKLVRMVNFIYNIYEGFFTSYYSCDKYTLPLSFIKYLCTAYNSVQS